MKKPGKIEKLEPQWRLAIGYFLLTLLVMWVWQELFTPVPLRTIPYSEFKKYLARHEVAEAVVRQDEIDGRAREGYDSVHGARPLKRFLPRHLETVLSRQILAGHDSGKQPRGG